MPARQPTLAKALLVFGALTLATTARPTGLSLRPSKLRGGTASQRSSRRRSRATCAQASALEQVPEETLDLKERALRGCLINTFVDRRPPLVELPDPLVARVLNVYHDYWARSLLHELSIAEGEAFLFAHLSRVLADSEGASFASLDALLQRLKAVLLARGFHSSSLGVTTPYREAMLWRQETVKTYTVELPEHAQLVRVVLMNDFVELGWAHFATCGKAYTGGWADHDTLYCVASSYDLDSEKFLVSYLGHEGQHFADYQAFPHLEQPELEYRAKLSELSKANSTAHSLLVTFASQMADSRSAPHAFANFRVVADLSRAIFGSEGPVVDEQRWASVETRDLNLAAVALLKENTKALVAVGAGTVTSILK